MQRFFVSCASCKLQAECNELITVKQEDFALWLLLDVCETQLLIRPVP